MAERMTEMEKLARLICWLEFAAPNKTGTTEARYWLAIAAETREEFIKEAHRFVWLFNRICETAASQAILDEARREAKKGRPHG